MDNNSQRLVMGAAGSASAPSLYVEDVFSTWLYTGNGSTQTITNGIDLSDKGGLVWIKGRSGATGHRFTDTARSATKSLESNSTAAEITESTGLTGFNSNGFAIGADTDYNTNAATYSSWTFRKAAKFFDVVTYTGNGSNRTVAHGLGSVPGCIIVKRTDATADWQVYHRSLANTEYLVLNSFAAKVTGATRWNSTTPTSSEFSLGTDSSVNASGGTYVAYVFAHNAGGFGSSGNDNIVSCGSFTANEATRTSVNLGWEPQFLILKKTNNLGEWRLIDSMRGWTVDEASNSNRLHADSSGTETISTLAALDSTGFSWGAEADSTYIYIAIRKGPMKTPTDATKVFGLNARSGTGANATVSGGQIADVALVKNRGSAVGDLLVSRMTGYAGLGYLETSSTAAQVVAGATILQANPWDVMDGVKVGTTSTITNASSNTFINYLFRRAPGFFDTVCYTATGSTGTVAHNLGVTPELMIVKVRSSSNFWYVYHVALGNTATILLDQIGAVSAGSNAWNNTTPTSSLFSRGPSISAEGESFIAYLFASCPGVSKVGSYTGTGATLSVDCGFTAGARFVLIKRTDASGGWYVWDTARGIIAANDPYLLLNSTAAEVTNTDYIDPLAAGFQISSTAPAAINANGGTYIYLAIA